MSSNHQHPDHHQQRSTASSTSDTFVECDAAPPGKVAGVPNPHRAIVMSACGGSLPLQRRGSEAAGQLYMLYLREELGKCGADVRLFTQSGFEDDVHSSVLCASSEYVCDVLRQVPPPLSLDLTPMRLDDAALAQCVHFAYNNEVTIQLSTCGRLLVAATALRMERLRRLVSAYMRAEAMLPQCAAQLYDMAFGNRGGGRLAMSMDAQLRGDIERRMCTAFTAVACTQAMAALTPPAMCALLGKGSEALGCPPPPRDQLFLVEAVAHWLQAKRLMHGAVTVHRVCAALDASAWSGEQLRAVLHRLREDDSRRPMLAEITGEGGGELLTARSGPSAHEASAGPSRHV